MPQSKEVADMQNKVAEFIETYGLFTDIQSRFIDLVSETGSLGKQILNSSDYGLRPVEKNDELSSKAGDTLFALLALLSDLGLNEEELLAEVLSRYEARMKELTKES